MSQSILFLHGAGASTKNRTKYLENILIRSGVKSYSFDFRGAGGNKSEMAKSSLRQRQSEAEKFIGSLSNGPMTVSGSSMGAYTAIKLTEKYPVENLILFCPAVYSKDAFNVNFDSKFTQIIRQKKSWLKSDAFDILKNFKGKVLIVIGDKDDVIPKKLLELLIKSLINAKSKEVMIIPDCPHAIHRWLEKNPEFAIKVAKQIVGFLK